jgi:hypothetical protein
MFVLRQRRREPGGRGLVDRVDRDGARNSWTDCETAKPA